MHGNIMPIKPEKPTEPVVKYHIITLTNRAPIRIVEEDWPIVAHGQAGEGFEDVPWGWKIEISVRQEKTKTKKEWDRQYLIHAEYHSFDESRADSYSANQIVRVGRIISSALAACELWKHISAVGDEVRERIINERMHKYITIAVDQCFSHLPAHDSR